MGRTLAQLRDRIITELGDDPSAPVIFTTDDTVDGWVEEAVDAVSEIRPVYATTTIAIVQDVYRYATPAGAIRFIRLAYIPSDDPGGEVEIEFDYEAARDQIKLLRNTGLASGTGLVLEYTHDHVQPTETTASTTLTNRHELAVIAHAVATGLLWLQRKVIAQNRGVVEFTRLNYSEKGGVASKVLADLSDKSMDRFRAILGAGDPAVSEGYGRPRQTLTGAKISEHGFTGEDDSTGILPGSGSNTNR